MSELSGKDRRALRALGHHLKPVVQIGHGGITDGLVEATERALADHELIKCKVLEGAPLEREQAAAALAEATGAELAQVLGRTFLLYKPHPEEPRIDLRRAGVREPPAAARGQMAGSGDRPAARKPRRAITQGASDEAPAGRKKGPRAARPARRPAREGTGAPLPPRRHR